MRPWWLRLAAYARPHWRGLLGIGFLLLGTSALHALKPWPMKILVDHVFGDRPFPSWLAWIPTIPGGGSAAGLSAWLAGSTLGIFAIAWATHTWQAYLQSGVALRITHTLGAKAFEHLQRLSLRFHSRQPTGDVVRRVTRDSRCARDLALDVIMPAIRSVITLGVMVVIMLQLNVTLTLIALLVAPALLTARMLFYRTMADCSYEQQQCEGQMLSHAEQALSAVPIVQAFRRENAEARQFAETADRTLQAYFRALTAQLKFRIWIGGSTTVCRVTVMTFGAYQVLQGDLTVGGLLVFLSYAGSLYEPLNTLGGNLTSSLASAEGSARRVFEILDADDRVPEATVTRVPASLPGRWRGDVQFEGVTFAYEEDHPVLHHLNLDVRAGEVVALVGRTGAGKSTLMSLLMRFFDPCEGRITLDGIDLREIPLATLRDQIAILLQDPFLLPVSIAENIAYGRPTATRDEIVAAAEVASADAFIRRLPNGYDTIIGERGATLSGGERQRLAIARTLLKDAPLLVLDEPTSALDAATELAITHAIEQLITGRTTFIIAHRSATIRRADRVVMLKDGTATGIEKNDASLGISGFCRGGHESRSDGVSVSQEFIGRS